MKKITLILFALFLFYDVNAQYFWGADYMPKPVYERDSIVIMDTVEPIGLYDTRESTAITFKSDSIIIEFCYKYNAGPTISIRKFDQTKLGKLQKGDYEVILKGKTFYGNDVDCLKGDSFLNSISFHMEVKASPNVISAIALSSVSISPTIVKDKIEISGLPNERSVIEVYDLQGKILHSITTKNSTTSLQMGNLTSGVYVISIRIGNEQRRWKILKE